MITRKLFNELLGIKENYEMPERLMEMLLDETEKESLFSSLTAQEQDMTKDWFTDLFQTEHGDRDALKQDFTPNGLCELIGMLSGNVEECADICAGTGGLTIKKWSSNHNCNIYCEEVSARTLPMLLLNLSIRNMAGIVIHGNSLTREIEATYLLKKGERYSKIFCQIPAQCQSTYQTVIMNPPYSLSWEDVGNYKNDERFAKYGIPPKKAADYAFVMHGLSKLSKNGELFAILPHGVLFRGGSEGNIRTNLIRANLIHAVIGLPDKMFLNTSIPVCIVVLKKDRLEREILFIDASKGYTQCGKQNVMQLEHINRIVSVYQARREEDKFSTLAEIKEIENNGYNLNIPRYVDTFEREEIPDARETLKQIGEIDKEIAQTEEKLYLMMRELYGTNAVAEREYKEVFDIFERNMVEKYGESFLTNS